MGKSGSGKSTLLNAVAGFLPVQQGKILFGEKDLTPLPPEKRRIAQLFQRPALFPHLNVIQNVEFAPRLQGVAKAPRREAAQKWLERLGISELAEREIAQISEGQAQRVALARALAAGFPLLGLDEPFSALDVVTRESLRMLVRKLVTESQISALMVTHHPEDAVAIADRIVVLESGKVEWEGTPEEYRKL